MHLGHGGLFLPVLGWFSSSSVILVLPLAWSDSNGL